MGLPATQGPSRARAYCINRSPPLVHPSFNGRLKVTSLRGHDVFASIEEAMDTNLSDDIGLESRLRRLGIVQDAFAAIQIDLNPVSKRVAGTLYDVTLCDHNCSTEVDGHPTGGNYTCPAAISLNRGLNRKDLAPTELLLSGLRNSIQGIRQSRLRFFSEHFPRYCQRYAVPEAVATAIRNVIDNDVVIVNLFGGSPEIHPGILTIVTELQREGNRVHLTTTGRRLMQDRGFRSQFLSTPPDILALGADDFESQFQLEKLLSLSLEQLRAEWQQVPWQHGQRKKVYEAIYILKLSQQDRVYPPILINMVLHPGNLTNIENILDTLASYMPQALLNPYPVQTAFLYRESDLAFTDLNRLAAFIDRVLDEHKSAAAGLPMRWPLVPRVHYWLMLKAALSGAAGNVAAKERVGGDSVWRCYAQPGAGRCVQIGSSQSPYNGKSIAGGHLGCFWNSETVTDARQVWNMSPAEVEEWVDSGRMRSAAVAARPCRGCAFPRMSFDGISLELGLDNAILPTYLALRREVAGY